MYWKYSKEQIAGALPQNWDLLYLFYKLSFHSKSSDWNIYTIKYLVCFLALNSPYLVPQMVVNKSLAKKIYTSVWAIKVGQNGVFSLLNIQIEVYWISIVNHSRPLLSLKKLIGFYFKYTCEKKSIVFWEHFYVKKENNKPSFP